jgi:hypothetical protein
MSKSIVNLTIPLVVAEVEKALKTYPHYPYQQLFANPDLHQELVAYVLTRIHSVYVAVDEGEKIANDIETISDSTETQACLESFIHQGIHYILQQHQALASFPMPAKNDGYLPVSHWFG